MSAKFPIPTAFISYSWTSLEHQIWVYKLATKLISDGVNVKLDKWDLKPGYDVNAYMEQMMTSDEIDKVLLICDKGYKIKADNRQGGVGIEAQIISPQVYNKSNQERFIPILAEHDDEGTPYLPIFVSSILYIDLSSVEGFENEYKKLLRLLFGKPEFIKPEMGSPPAWLFHKEDKLNTRNVVESYFRIGTTLFQINGFTIKMDGAPFKENDDYYVMLPYVAQALDIKKENVLVDHINGQVVLVRNNRVLAINMTESYSIINGAKIVSPPAIVGPGDIVWLPLRLTATALGASFIITGEGTDFATKMDLNNTKKNDLQDSR